MKQLSKCVICLTFLFLIYIPTHKAYAFGVTNSSRANDLTIELINNTFDQKTVSMHPGDTLTIRNKDKVTHNIQFVNKDGAIDDKGLQRPGAEVKETFSDPGIYHARCALNPKMDMVITVDSSQAQPTAPNTGSKRILQK